MNASLLALVLLAISTREQLPGATLRIVSPQPGDSVDLRAEMNVLVILNTCQHALDPNPKYQPRPVEVSIRQVAPPAMDDICRNSRPENGRGFTLTERYFL